MSSLNYGSDDDLLVVTGGVRRGVSEEGATDCTPYNPNLYNVNNEVGASPQTDTDFALSLQQQRSEMRLASHQATNMRHEAALQNNTVRSVVPVPEGLPAHKSSASTSGVAARRASTKITDVASANAKVSSLEEEIKGLTNQLHNQSKGLQRMTTESEKQCKLIATLNSRIDKEAALNRDLTAKLKIAEAQNAAQKKEIQTLQRDAGGLTSITSDVRLQKALEEIATLKAKLASAGAVSYSGTLGGALPTQTVQQQQTDQLVRDKKKLEAQRVELLNCIRKQNKLIEVLRRQKLHLEAAKLLQMTEDDFTRVLEAQ